MNTLHLVDPELRPALANYAPLTLTHEAIVALRQQRQNAALAAMSYDDGLPLTLREQPIPADGAPPVRVLIITQRRPRPGQMGILHLHGGGHLFGSPEQSLSLTRATAAEQDCVVVSVDYRLSPETRAQGQLADCYTALAWMHQQAAELGIDPTRIGVMGDSAGAGLAAGLALLARDRQGPPIAFQNLMFPMLDDRTVTETATNPVSGEFVWTREENRFGWRAFLGCEPGSEDVSPYAAPGRAQHLGALPPTWIGVGTLDLFVDEDLRYARRLMHAGCALELQVWPGAWHGFTGDPQAAVARRARAQRQQWLRQFNAPQPE